MLHRSWCVRIAPALLSAVLLASPVLAAPSDAQRIERILEQTPLIDGHNDLPWEIRARFGGQSRNGSPTLPGLTISDASKRRTS